MKVLTLAESVAKPQGAAQALAGEVQIFLPMAGLVDLGAEKARLEREKGKAEGALAAQLKKLENEAFVSKAPAKVITIERAKVGELEASIAKLSQSLKELGG
jgi:valyl-tRNA synthetase